MKEKERYLTGLLNETLECVEAAISLEIEYNDFNRAQKLKLLKEKIKRELENVINQD